MSTFASPPRALIVPRIISGREYSAWPVAAGIVERRLVGDRQRQEIAPSASARRFSASRCARISGGGNGEAATAPTGCHPSPCRAARRSAARECPPTQIGRCGFYTAKGSQRISE
jgi:hypothetical protein